MALKCQAFIFQLEFISQRVRCDGVLFGHLQAGQMCVYVCVCVRAHTTELTHTAIKYCVLLKVVNPEGQADLNHHA